MGPTPQRRLELENLWRKRVRATWVRYQQATEDLRQVQLQSAHDLPSPDGHYAVIQTQRVEIRALKPYCEAIKVLQEFQVYGTLPPLDD